jgi:hypothetical protein
MKEAAAAFMIGWIEIGELEVYSHYRRHEIYKKIMSYDEKIFSVSATVSLVPICGGQFMTSSKGLNQFHISHTMYIIYLYSIYYFHKFIFLSDLSYIHDWVKVNETQLHVSLVDISNGSDLELPPNGRASAEGIKNALTILHPFSLNWRK